MLPFCCLWVAFQYTKCLETSITVDSRFFALWRGGVNKNEADVIFSFSHTHTQRKKYLYHALPGLYNFPHGTACSRRFLFLSLASSSHPLSLQQILIMFDGWCSCLLDFLTCRFRGQMMNLSELPAILNSWASKAGVSNSFSPGHHVSLALVFESNQRDT